MIRNWMEIKQFLVTQGLVETPEGHSGLDDSDPIKVTPDGAQVLFVLAGLAYGASNDPLTMVGSELLMMEINREFPDAVEAIAAE